MKLTITIADIDADMARVVLDAVQNAQVSVSPAETELTPQHDSAEADAANEAAIAKQDKAVKAKVARKRRDAKREAAAAAKADKTNGAAPVTEMEIPDDSPIAGELQEAAAIPETPRDDLTDDEYAANVREIFAQRIEEDYDNAVSLLEKFGVAKFSDLKHKQMADFEKALVA